jgi:hypothetical protein
VIGTRRMGKLDARSRTRSCERWPMFLGFQPEQTPGIERPLEEADDRRPPPATTPRRPGQRLVEVVILTIIQSNGTEVVAGQRR